MEYRRVGRSGLKISEISIGGWITMGGTIKDRHAGDILHAAIDAGINFIDLADVYAGGAAEKVAGEVLKDVRRSKLVISSKVFWPMGSGPNDRGLSRKHIIDSCEGSLRRLQTDYLDLYFCHRYDDETPLDETVRAMDDLVRQGKIRYWGTSVWTAEQLHAARQTADDYRAYEPIVEQPRYNLFDRQIETDGVLSACRELGVGLVVWSPLAQGLLAGKYDDGIPEDSRAKTTSWLDARMTEENLERSRKFSALAWEVGVKPGQLALAWILRRPEISSVITGASRPEQVQENVHASEIVVSDELAARIEAIFAEA